MIKKEIMDVLTGAHKAACRVRNLISYLRLNGGVAENEINYIYNDIWKMINRKRTNKDTSRILVNRNSEFDFDTVKDLDLIDFSKEEEDALLKKIVEMHRLTELFLSNVSKIGILEFKPTSSKEIKDLMSLDPLLQDFWTACYNLHTLKDLKKIPEKSLEFYHVLKNTFLQLESRQEPPLVS